jgi:hypothetical protein
MFVWKCLQANEKKKKTKEKKNILKEDFKADFSS